MSTEPKPKRRKGEKKSKYMYKVGNDYMDLEFWLKKDDKEDDKEAEEAADAAESADAANSKDTATGTKVDETSKAPPSTTNNGSSTSCKRQRQRQRQRRDDDYIAGDPSLFAVRKELPIWNSRKAIRDALAANDVLILAGETGSGKSTQVPQYLCTEPWCTGMVAITQPRRVAATTLANRVAREMGTPLTGLDMSNSNSNSNSNSKDGKAEAAHGRVGYSVRFDHKVPKGTKIKFLTEGMLLQEMVRNPALTQYSVIVVDEVHERSADADLLLGFLRLILTADREDSEDSNTSELVKRQRGDNPLKVVVMSATANVDKMRKFFTAPCIAENLAAGDAALAAEAAGASTAEANASGAAAGAIVAARRRKTKVDVLFIPGRQFPVDIVYTPQRVDNIIDTMVETVMKIHVQEPLPGDILCFLSGQEEIDMAKRRLEEQALTLASNVPRMELCPLYGQLTNEVQNKAFQPATRAFTRKVVLATNIAETSVTVPGVRYVVDNGKAKYKMYRARVGLESLLVKPIAQSSAIQRAGRAGREGPGKCFRLYPEEAFRNVLPAVEVPEILRMDILGAVLTMKARGIYNPLLFPLMDEPSDDLVQKAVIQLWRLGALDNATNITEDGKKMALLPVSVAFGRVLLNASKAGCLLEAIDIVACLTAGDSIFQRLSPGKQQQKPEKPEKPQKNQKQRQQQQQQDDDDDNDDNDDNNDGNDDDDDDDEVEAARKELFRREGDLLTYLTAMQRLVREPASQWKAWCQKRRVDLRNMRQAVNVRRQLRSICVRQQLVAASDVPTPADELADDFVPLGPDRTDVLLRCFLDGFVLRTATLSRNHSYITTEGKHVVSIHPSSVLRGRKTEAIMYLEQVYTTKNYVRKVSAVQSAWISDLLKQQEDKEANMRGS